MRIACYSLLATTWRKVERMMRGPLCEYFALWAGAGRVE